MRTRIVGPVVVAAALTAFPAAPAQAAVGTTPASSSSAVGPVLESVESGGRLYIGGTFTKVDGNAHAGLAALDASTGVRVSGFSADVNGAVRALATDGTNVFVGGSFTSVDGVTRTNLAAVTPSGQVLGAFNPKPSSTVDSLAYANGRLYVSGAFTSISGVARRYLAALDPTTGAVVSGFNPQPNARVDVVKTSGTQIYVGGRFTTIGGVARNSVASLTATGAVNAHNARLGNNAQVHDIAPTSTAVYLATGGGLPNGNSVYATAAGSGARSWQQKFDGDVEAVEFEGGNVYAGGHFNNTCTAGSSSGCTVSLSARKSAVMNAATGQASRFATFNSTHGVWDITKAGGNLYVLGEFTRVNGKVQAGIARFPIR